MHGLPLVTSVHYGDLRIEMVGDLGGRVERDVPMPGSGVRGRRYAQAWSPAPALLGRAPQINDAHRAIRVHVPVEFSAPCGFGKSTLLRHVAAEVSTRLRVPAIYLDAHGDDAADLLQRLTSALYAMDRPVKATPDECKQLLDRAAPVVVLDDLTCDLDQLAYLLQMLSGCHALLGSDRPRLGRYGRSYVLPGLSDEAALALVRHDLGRPLTAAELPAVRRLVAAVAGQPLRLRQASALVRAGGESFAELARTSEAEPATLDRLSVDALAETDRRVLAVLSLLGGALLPTDLVAMISNVGEVARSLAELRDRGLVDQHDDRFGLPVCQVDSYRAILPGYVGLGEAIRDIVGWLDTRDPTSEASLSAVNGVLSLIGFAAERRDWDGVARLVRVIQPILTLAGRWETCRVILDVGVQAASTVGDAAAEALFSHQQGTLAQCLGDVETARESLAHALELRERLDDRIGAELTRHNLHQLPGPLIPPAHVPVVRRRPPPNRPKRWVAVAAGVLAVLVLGVVAVASAGGSGGDPSATPPLARPTTTSPSAGPRPSGPTTSAPTRTDPTRTDPTTTRATGPRPPPRPPVIESSPPNPLRANVTGNEPTMASVKVTNPNDDSITLVPSRVTGDPAFTISKNCVPPTLAPAGACQLTLAFDPSRIGRHQGTLVVSDDAGRTSSVQLDGIGFAVLTIAGDAAQSVTVTGGGEPTCSAVCQVEVSEPGRVTLTAPPRDCSQQGCSYVRWDGGGCSAAASTCELELVEDVEVSATFEFEVG